MLFEAWCLETACLLEVHDTLGDGFLTEACPTLLLLRKHLPVPSDQAGLGALQSSLWGQASLGGVSSSQNTDSLFSVLAVSKRRIQAV